MDGGWWMLWGRGIFHNESPGSSCFLQDVDAAIDGWSDKSSKATYFSVIVLICADMKHPFQHD